MYAVAALVWDRRRELSDGGVPVRRDVAGRVTRSGPSVPTMVVAGALVLGTALLVGATVAMVHAGAALLPA
jgi:hypothetical protein